MARGFYKNKLKNKIMKLTDLEIHIKRERLIDWINQMDEIGLDELIEEYL